MHEYLYTNRQNLLAALTKALAYEAYNIPSATCKKLLTHLDSATVTLNKLRSPEHKLTALETRSLQEAHWSLSYCATRLGLTAMADELRSHAC